MRDQSSSIKRKIVMMSLSKDGRGGDDGRRGRVEILEIWPIVVFFSFLAPIAAAWERQHEF